jgi:hypothetical protein
LPSPCAFLLFGLLTLTTRREDRVDARLSARWCARCRSGLLFAVM